MGRKQLQRNGVCGGLFPRSSSLVAKRGLSAMEPWCASKRRNVGGDEKEVFCAASEVSDPGVRDDVQKTRCVRRLVAGAVVHKTGPPWKGSSATFRSVSGFQTRHGCERVGRRPCSTLREAQTSTWSAIEKSSLITGGRMLCCKEVASL